MPGPEPHLSVVHVVVTDEFAGVERYICQVANQLAARGHDVATIGGDPQRMRTELDGNVHNLPAPTLLRAARAVAGQRGADLIHVHMTAAEGAAWLARPRQRAPIVATRHFARERGSSTTARWLARITSRALTSDIAISQFVADSITGPSVLIPNGVSDHPQADLESTQVVMLQRLDTEKAPEVGIRAWAISGLGDQGWRLVIAGKGGLRPALARLVDDLDVAGSVDFVGHVGDTDRLLTGSSLLLAPAPAEPFGLSVVEAMAHGIPVIAARGGAHVETVGEDGELFAPGDPTEAAAALVRLGQDAVLRRRVGARLRQRQQDMFSLPRHVDRLEELYRQVVDDRRGTGPALDASG
jgi:glycosyltransferase involved in cell wall biosynthesis